jgi:tetratricopeptide (TPR) repeat protein
MHGFRGQARFSEYLSFAGLQFRAAILALMLMAVGVLAQKPSQASPGQAAISGVVLDSSGKPVTGAMVRLEQAGNADIQTTTKDDGIFFIADLHAGTYRIHAEKSGLSSKAITANAQAGDVKLTLVIETTDAASGSASSSEAMTFADKPNFTVAGITDWTAAGGHGSDITLRTSEALARETASLKPASPEGGISGAAPEGQSEARLRAAAAQSPKSFEANRQLGEYCLRMKSYREAIPPLSAAYQIDPANYANEYDLALAYQGAGEFAQAREHIQKLLAHEEKADLHRLAGDVDEAAGDSLSAVREYERAAQLDPSEQNYFAWGSELLLHRAVWPATEVFRKGAKTHPKSERMLAALGAALFAGALYDEAALRLCDASDLNPADQAPYIFLGKIDIAAPTTLPCVEPRLKRFAKEQPGDAQANYYYAMVMWKQKPLPLSASDTQSIEMLLNKAVTIDPKYGEAYLQLGILYSSVEHDFQKAIGFYQKAIEAEPQLSDAHYRLGVAYERTGQAEKARQEFQLHDEIEKQQAAAVEQQRREIKQFLVVLQNGPTLH